MNDHASGPSFKMNDLSSFRHSWSAKLLGLLAQQQSQGAHTLATVSTDSGFNILGMVLGAKITVLKRTCSHIYIYRESYISIYIYTYNR